MAAESIEAIGGQRYSSSLLLDFALSGCDEIIEMDLAHGQLRNVRHAEGKYFVPIAHGALRDIIWYSANNMIHPEDRETFLGANDLDTLLERLAASEDGTLRCRVRYKLLDGGWCWVDRIVVDGRRHGLPEGIVFTFVFDVEQNKTRAANRTAREPNLIHNELTGLLQAEGFFAQARDIVRSHPAGWSMLAIDLEQFKLFNEWYGREQGDLLLAQIGAQVLRAEEETGGLAGYLGQDDFALLAPLSMDRIRELYAAIHGLIMQYGTSVGFMPAFGVAQVEAGGGVEELYDRAAIAARRAKENYHTRIRAFEPSMYQQTEADYRILSDFQKALRDHELFIMLQPQCKIKTKRIVGAESLVRWRKTNGEMMSPGVFVPVLEKYGFVTDLDKYVWEEVCIWQKKWIDGGHTPLPVSVNVSQIDIFTIDVPAYFEMLIKKYALSVDTVKVEITESAYVDNGKVVDTVQRLREKGFLVLMDDFGSGYSSLNMLRSLNVDIIKLDAQFLRMSGSDTKGVHILESIVNMAKTMGVPIIVEGVETKEETEFLSGLGCRYVQGYYFYRPMPVPDFESLIGESRNIDTGGFTFKAQEQFHTREFLDQNVFSDAMLNNILGPVAFFLLRGSEVDCIRYNQQFYNEVHTERFDEILKSSQRFLLDEDLPVLYGLLEQAMFDPLGGAAGVLRFPRADGTVSQYRMHFFFLGEDEAGKRFYASMRDITQLGRLGNQLWQISRLSNDEVVFLRRLGSGYVFQVTVHGLEDILGLSREDFEDMLNTGRFREYTGDEAWRGITRMIHDAGAEMKDFSAPIPLRGTTRPVSLQYRLDSVHDKTSGVEYILLFRKSAG